MSFTSSTYHWAVDCSRLDTKSTDTAWSPDGTRIAFESERDGDAEVYIMNADGSGLTRITDSD